MRSFVPSPKERSEGVLEAVQRGAPGTELARESGTARVQTQAASGAAETEKKALAGCQAKFLIETTGLSRLVRTGIDYARSEILFESASILSADLPT
jgi:hypothetical protein